MANQLLVTQIGRPRSISWELLAAALTLALIFHSPASCQEIPLRPRKPWQSETP